VWRVGPWARAVDISFVALLLILAGSIVGAHPGWAALLVGFGVAGLVAFLIFEPALVRAAFPPPGAPAIVAPTPMAGRPRGWPLALGLVAVPALVVLGVAVGLNLGGVRERLLGTGVPRIESIAVLPLENLSRDPEQEYFADGMTEALISDLAQIRALRVISRTSVMQYKGARKPLPEIARELNVDAVVAGSVQRAGDRVRITAQLIHAPTDRHLWAQSYERDLRDVLSLQDEVARAIASEIRVTLTPQEQAQLISARPVNPLAHESYLKGLYYMNKFTEEGVQRGLEYFQAAIDKDPAYAPAYVGVAGCHFRLGFFGSVPPKEGFEKSRAAVLKALEIDDTLAAAHAVLGFNKFILDLDWAGAEAEFKRALELNPNDAEAHANYRAYLVVVGRLEEALAENKRAEELDPLSLRVSVNVGWDYYYMRQYDRAVEKLKQTLEMDSNFPLTHYSLGVVYVQKGMHEEAIAEYQKALSIEKGGSPFVLGLLGHAYGVAGKRAEALKILKELKQQAKHRYVSSYHIALVYLGLGEEEQALAWLEKSREERHYWVLFIQVSPMLDPLRDDPRFQALLRRMNFPQ